MPNETAHTPILEPLGGGCDRAGCFAWSSSERAIVLGIELRLCRNHRIEALGSERFAALDDELQRLALEHDIVIARLHAGWAHTEHAQALIEEARSTLKQRAAHERQVRQELLAWLQGESSGRPPAPTLPEPR